MEYIVFVKPMVIRHGWMNFSAAVNTISYKLNRTLAENEQLILYGLYKQSISDCHEEKPDLLADYKKALWDAWKLHQGKHKDNAVA